MFQFWRCFIRITWRALCSSLVIWILCISSLVVVRFFSFAQLFDGGDVMEPSRIERARTRAGFDHVFSSELLYNVDNRIWYNILSVSRLSPLEHISLKSEAPRLCHVYKLERKFIQDANLTSAIKILTPLGCFNATPASDMRSTAPMWDRQESSGL